MTPAGAIEMSGVARWMREALWAYPTVEAVHIVGIAIVVGSIAMLDLRLLGLSRGLSVARLARHTLPWTLAAFAMVGLTGILMFTAHATDFLTNPVFMLKMGLILLAGINAGLLHAGAMRHAAQWDVDTPPSRVRIAAAISLLLWIGVIFCGRFLAYT